MRIAFTRGELQYRARSGRFFLQFDVSVGEADDGRVVVSCEKSADGLSVTLVAREDIELEALHVRASHAFGGNERFFLNGYQSWTDSREFDHTETISPFPTLLRPMLTRTFKTNRYGDYDIVRTRGQHLRGFTYFYCRSAEQQEIQFVGSLSEDEGFTVFHVLPEEMRLVVGKECEGKRLRRGDRWPALRLFFASGEEAHVFDAWAAQFFSTTKERPVKAERATGWTSWYYHYTAISERITLQNLDAFARREIPIDVFQIDDGWQGAVGDWLTVNEKFPHGLGWLTDRIREKGYRAGLWLAPFVAEKSSRLVAEHPDWLLRDRRGAPVPAGNNALWSGDFYGLDIGHGAFEDYLKRVFDTVLGEWGFDLVKLDFLYGACLVPLRGKTRGELMAEAMRLCRRLVGSKQILGCGVPLGPALGRVEYCRIGPDVGHEWKNTLTRGLGMRETISTVTALENAIGRRQLSGRVFLNDPDVFFLRELSFENERFNPLIAFQELRHGRRAPLNKDEKHSLFLLNNLFGDLVFTSDDISEYTSEQMALYRSAFPLLPKEDMRVSLVGLAPSFGEVGGTYEIRFRIGALHYLVIANLSDEPFRHTLDAEAFSRDEQLAGRFHRAGDVIALNPHASICLLLPSRAELALLGSESSLFPGSDIAEIIPEGPDRIIIHRHARAIGEGQIFLGVPRGCQGLFVNGSFVPAKPSFGHENVALIDAASLPRKGRSR